MGSARGAAMIGTSPFLLTKQKTLKYTHGSSFQYDLVSTTVYIVLLYIVAHAARYSVPLY